MDDNLVVTPDEASSSVGKADILINLESMIKSNLGAIDRLQEELKKHKGLLDDIFNNDATYKKHSDEAKEAAKVKANTKAQILKQPQAADLNNKVKTMQSELKEMQGALSDYLQQFAEMSGVNEIEDDSGDVRLIVYQARLVRKAPIESFK